MVEAMAMKKGVEFTKDMLFLDVIVESDSQNVISAVTDVQLPLSYMGTIVDDCRLLTCHFQNLQFVHIRHEANQAAHQFFFFF
jgi:ribonuclease HI